MITGQAILTARRQLRVSQQDHGPRRDILRIRKHAQSLMHGSAEPLVPGGQRPAVVLIPASRRFPGNPPGKGSLIRAKRERRFAAVISRGGDRYARYADVTRLDAAADRCDVRGMIGPA